MESTLHCRQHASLFDVSHMCGLSLKVRRSRRLPAALTPPDCLSSARLRPLPPPLSPTGPSMPRHRFPGP